MNIALNDICDMTIYGLRNKLLRLQQEEFSRVIFVDNTYCLEMTAKKATITKLTEEEPLYKVEYNLDKDFIVAFAGISQALYKLCDLRYPSGRK